jgi:uracil-DNA glycosylase
VSAARSGVVFLLWGKPAQAQAALIDGKKHHILKAPHPSPLSAHTGFTGCKHFSAANALLAKQGLPPIDWALRE